MKKFFLRLLWDKDFECLFSMFLKIGFVLLAVLFGFWLYDGEYISPRLAVMADGSLAFFGVGFFGCLALYVLRFIFRKHKPVE